MSISRQNLTIVIVTIKSDDVIHNCINSINKDVSIIVVENSNNSRFKDELEGKYKNVKCLIAKKNLGMGAGNNIGIKKAKTDYVFIVNPDVTLEPNTLEELFSASEKIEDFAILSPISSNLKFPNYGVENKKEIENNKTPFKVDYVDGFAMILNKKKFNDDNFFDENFFLYLENNDLCKRIKKKGESIFIAPDAKVNHAGGKTVNIQFSQEIELTRNWHWIWSKFYYNKKHYGKIKAVRECLGSYISAVLKFIFYLIINNKLKKNIYFNRAAGFYNALLGKPSWYRPNLKE